MSTETQHIPHEVRCVHENCSAFWTGLKWTVPDDDKIPDSVIEHEHVTIGGETFRTEADVPESCDGNPEPPHRSVQYRHAIEAAMNYLEARKLYEQAYRQLLGRSLLVPEHEHRDLTAEILVEYQARGFELPRSRGVTFVDVSDMFH